MIGHERAFQVTEISINKRHSTKAPNLAVQEYKPQNWLIPLGELCLYMGTHLFVLFYVDILREGDCEVYPQISLVWFIV